MAGIGLTKGSSHGGTSDTIEYTVPESVRPTTAEGLSETHRNYLMERHGTLELNPLPSMNPADPLNWPVWKKKVNLFLVSMHSFMATFTAAAIIPAYMNISEDLGVSIQTTSYLTSAHIALVGTAPLLWRPLSDRIGRRPVFIFSMVAAAVCNIGCAKSPGYGAMMACRVLGAAFISPAMAIGSAVVTETFFAHERSRNMGVWTLMLTIGVPIAPLVFGPVVTHLGYRWIYWILAATNGASLLFYLPLGPETLYREQDFLSHSSAFKAQFLSLRRIDSSPLTISEIVRPLRLFASIPVLVAASSYAMVFLFGSILCSVEIPTILQVKFRLNAQQLGFQFVPLIIGSILGELSGGRASDFWMLYRARRLKRTPDPEFRLWLSYIGYILLSIGIVVFLVCVDKAHGHKWTVTPIIGTAIAAFGNQVVGTVLTTYAVDVHPQEAGSVGAFVNAVRCVWGFIGPFWFQSVFDCVGTAASSGVFIALIFGVSFVPTVVLQYSRSRLSK